MDLRSEEEVEKALKKNKDYIGETYLEHPHWTANLCKSFKSFSERTNQRLLSPFVSIHY